MVDKSKVGYRVFYFTREFMSLNNLKDIAWRSAQVVTGSDPDHMRQDACGAWIAYEDFNNRESMFGWEIEHIYPSFRLKRLNVPEKLWDNELNIRALHWKNHQSKGGSYPMYTAMITHEGKTNVESNFTYLVNEALQDCLRKLFKVDE